MGPMPDRKAKRVEDGASINLNHDRFYTRIVAGEKMASYQKLFGEFSFTHRGFHLVEFLDRNGVECNIQQSSAMDDEHLPGQAYLWLGVDAANPQILKSQAVRMGLPVPPGEVSGWMPYPVPDGVSMTTRMHLNREQVAGLIMRLQAWLDTGELKEPGE